MFEVARRASLIVFFIVSSGCLAEAADWILSRRVNDSRLMSVVRKPAVLADLELTAGQRGEIQQLNDEIDRTLLTLRNRRKDYASQGFSRLTASTRDRLEAILTARQFNRLAQIIFHVRGSRAVLTDSLEKRLTITAKQRQSISKIIDATNRATITRSKADDFTNVDERISVFADEDRKILDLLTDQQRELLAAMSGREFDRAQLTGIRYRAPDFVGGRWVNTQEPVELASFRGKVLVVHFWAFG